MPEIYYQRENIPGRHEKALRFLEIEHTVEGYARLIGAD
jgi:hypothetical protein